MSTSQEKLTNGVHDLSINDEDIDFSDIEQKSVSWDEQAAVHDGRLTSRPSLPRRYAVRFDEGLDHVVVIDNVPVVDDAKKGKLLDVIVKRIKSQVGVDVDKESFHMPFGSDGNSKG